MIINCLIIIHIIGAKSMMSAFMVGMNMIATNAN